MEPDDVEVSGVNGERFEDLREAARLLGRRAAMEGLSTGSAVLSTSPPDSSGSGGRNEPPVCSPPLPQDITLHGATGPPPDEACTCDVLAHLSLASSATRELVRRTKVAGPVAALLHGSASAAVREAAARLACSPAWRDAIAEEAGRTDDAVGLGGSAARGGIVGSSGAGVPAAGVVPAAAAGRVPFFVRGVRSRVGRRGRGWGRRRRRGIGRPGTGTGRTSRHHWSEPGACSRRVGWSPGPRGAAG